MKIKQRQALKLQKTKVIRKFYLDFVLHAAPKDAKGTPRRHLGDARGMPGGHPKDNRGTPRDTSH